MVWMSWMQRVAWKLDMPHIRWCNINVMDVIGFMDVMGAMGVIGLKDVIRIIVFIGVIDVLVARLFYTCSACQLCYRHRAS